jgi:hypothetical protein
MEKYKQLVVRVEESLKFDFDKFCKENGYSPSKRIRLLIESDIKQKLIK